jgi:O-antigen/teichoic acid export membrane protein
MFDHMKRLSKHWGSFGLGVVLSKTVGFFMVPLYTRRLSPADYGLLELLDLMIFFTGIFAAAGIHSAIFRFYSRAEDEIEKTEIVRTAQVFFVVSSLVFASLVFWLAPFLARNLLGDSSQAELVRIVSLTIFFANMCEVPLAYLRASHRVPWFVTVGVSRTFVGASALIVALVGFNAGVKGVLFANLASNMFFGLVLSAGLLFKLGTHFSGPIFRKMATYGLPLVGQSLGSFILVFSDRFFLRHFGTLEQVGVYALAYKFASVLSMFVSGPFALAWQSNQFEIAKDKNAHNVFGKALTLQFSVAMTLAMAIALFSRDAIRILAPAQYSSAYLFVPILVLSYVLADLRQIVMSGLHITSHTRHIAVLASIVAALNLLLNWTLIPKYLAWGAAIATLASYFVHLVLVWYQAQRLYHVRYEYFRLALIVTSWLLLVVIKNAVPLLPIRYSVLVSAALFVAFLGCIWGTLDGAERKRSRQVFQILASKIRFRRTQSAESVLSADAGGISRE